MSHNGEPHRKELDGLLGMCEMECAVEPMLQKSERFNIPFNELFVRPDEFSKDTLVGFCQLLVRGYMIPLYPNMYFGVGQDLIDIMRKREPWSALKNALTFQEYFDKLHPDFVQHSKESRR